MAQRPDLSRYLDAGAEFVALTRSQARARARELVGQGQLAQEQVQGFVDELMDESRRRTDDMLDVVRREIQRQVKTLGIATKDDLARLESRIARVADPVKQTAGASKATRKATKQPAKKAAKKAARQPPRKATKQPARKAVKTVKTVKRNATKRPSSPGA